jgi:hypothetical protein
LGGARIVGCCLVLMPTPSLPMVFDHAHAGLALLAGLPLLVLLLVRLVLLLVLLLLLLVLLGSPARRPSITRTHKLTAAKSEPRHATWGVVGPMLSHAKTPKRCSTIIMHIP